VDLSPCSNLHKVPVAELEACTREIYRNLSDWLRDKIEAEVERRYTELGAARAQQGVAYSYFVWAIISTKERVRAFVQREGLSDSAMELHGERSYCTCSASSSIVRCTIPPWVTSASATA
jgi:hypothetical protein